MVVNGVACVKNCFPIFISFFFFFSCHAFHSLEHSADSGSPVQNSSQGEDECCIYGVSAMQGWRISMEDAHAAVLDLQANHSDKDTNEPTDPAKRLAFFGVYDGHGGDKVALFAGDTVHKIVANQESFAKGDVEQALKDGFLATDRAILEGSF